MANYVLDTGLLLGFSKNAPWANRVREECKLFAADATVYTSIVCHGEMLAIAERRQWQEAKRAKLREILKGIPAMGIDAPEILSAYAKISAWTKHGKSVAPSGEKPPKPAISMAHNDLWVAATAYASRATLLSTDKDFEHMHDIWFPYVYVDRNSN